jgi:hypothetical protein
MRPSPPLSYVRAHRKRWAWLRTTQAHIGAIIALGACGSTPGLTLKCDGRCHVAPANVGQRPEPGQCPTADSGFPAVPSRGRR